MFYTAADKHDYHELFSSAEHEINILSGIHDLEYAEVFIEAACNFLSRPGSMLHLACQCGAEMSSCHIIQKILAARHRQGTIMLYAAQDFRDEPYLIIADKSAYRMEIIEQAETILDYDDQEEAARLYAHFQHILSLSLLTAYRPPLQFSYLN
ncbi:hypothetical protein ACFL5J_00225 [Thermodesulfobacteriota bacterium]